MSATRLPDKPSELLLLALEDLEKCERDPRYDIDMAVWLRTNGRCSVCLAGAVMAQRLDGEKLTHEDSFSEGHVVEPWDFDTDTDRKLRALDYLRLGDVDEALERMRLPPLGDEAGSFGDAAPAYARTGKRNEQWKHAMLGLVGILQAEGL